MKIKNFKIGTKINLMIVGIILFLSIIISLVAKYQIEKAMIGVFTDRVEVESQLEYNWMEETYPGDWAILDGELYKGKIKINDHNELVDKMGEITNGTATIFQGDTTVATNIIFDGERRNGQKADPVISAAVLDSNEIYVGEADIAGQKYLTRYQPIKDKNGETIGMWLVGSPIDVIDKTVQFLLLIIASVLILSGFVAIVISIFITRTIVSPIRTINGQLKEIADGEGDLTKELVIRSKDEIGELAFSFNRMLSSLREMIGQIGTTSEHVASSSEQLTTSAEQTLLATNQITSSIKEVANGADIQGKSAIESSHAMKEIAIGVQQVAQTTSSVSVLATETNKEANVGNESIQKVIRQMNAINTSVRDSATVIQQLGEQSNRIYQITEVITGIADQTNLLALNAAIESARAGEHGKGFAVVADEVRKLAEQSKDSAEQITSLIAQIQVDTSRAVSLMETGTQEVSLGMQVVQETGEGFQKILKSIDKVTSQIHDVSAVSEEMSASVEQVNASIEEMAHISQNSASNTQYVASASEQQKSAMEEIATATTSLSRMAEDLQLLVNKFKVK